MTEHFRSETQLLTAYNDYQRRYATTIRESDKVLLRLIAQRPEARTLLDIGCSTGNFLAHVRRAFPHLALTGGDVAEDSLAKCRENPRLAVVDIRHMDITAIEGRYDIITSVAVTSIVPDAGSAVGKDDFERGMASVSRALNPGGSFISWEWMHPFNGQTIEILEKTPVYPDGLWLYFRPYANVRRALEAAGLVDITFTEFHLPIELPFKGYDSNVTYTRDDAQGRHMSFRGILYQPWAFVTAKRPAA
jgi:SAM-dependent methyltransferase